jgi:hypothetical protein
MKASELIKEIQQQIDDNGSDVDVYFVNDMDTFSIKRISLKRIIDKTLSKDKSLVIWINRNESQ